MGGPDRLSAHISPIAFSFSLSYVRGATSLTGGETPRNHSTSDRPWQQRFIGLVYQCEGGYYPNLLSFRVCMYLGHERRETLSSSCLVLSCLVLSCLVLSCLVLSC